MHDYHVHSMYSDGSFLPGMVRAAESAGLDGVGIADHCIVSARDGKRQGRAEIGFTLDLTYERRRRAIEELRRETKIEIYDAVEMDYDPRDESELRAFLDEAAFDYALGSVHGVEGTNVQVASAFDGRSDAELDAIVERYVDKLVALIESELFDVAAHVDLVERTPPLRGRTTEEQYLRVARAFAGSRTIPEINAGRALTDAGIVHPAPGLLDAFREYDVPVTVGSDAHSPAELRDRADFLAEFLAEQELDPAEPPGL